MPEAQPTNNPVPSDHPADARDNFKRIDEVVNLQSPMTNLTRTGIRVQTLFGVSEAAETQREQFESTFSAQFSYLRIGNISDYAGDTLPESDKLNSYQFPDDSGDWYGPIQSQTFPITIPSNPSSSDNWALVNALTIDDLLNRTTATYRQSTGMSPIDNMKSGSGSAGEIYSTSGYYTDGDGGSATYINRGQGWPVVADGYIDHAADNGDFLEFQVEGSSIDIRQAGALMDGSTDNIEPFKAAISITKPEILDISIPRGTCRLSETLNLKKVVRIHGAAGTQASPYLSTLSFDDNLNGIIIHRADTMCDAQGLNKSRVPTSTGSGEGSVIEHLAVIRGDGTDTTTDNRFHGIRYVGRGLVKSCSISGFQGCGIYIVAAFSTGVEENYGNANNWHLENVRSQNNYHGIFVDLADVNAGVAVHGDFSSNRGCGIYDSSFLGCQWVSCHMNGNGTDNVAGLNYDLLHDNANARSCFMACYIEAGGSARAIYPALRAGGDWAGVAIEGNLLQINEGTSILNNLESNIDAVGTTTGTGAYIQAWNKGSFSSSRGAAIEFRSGTDASNQNTARVAGLGGGGNLSSRGQLSLDIFDGTLATPAYEPALRILGVIDAIAPGTDDTWSGGTASLRYSEIFAANGTINTSDEREKTDVKTLSDAEEAVAIKLKGLIRRFKWKKAVEEKGDSARYHFGVMAQSVVEAFQSEGLDPFEYGIVCYDEWDETPEVKEPVVDDDGNETGDFVVTQQHAPAGNRYGVRYEELLCFVMSVI